MNTAKQFLAGIVLVVLSAASTYAISSYNLTGLGNLGGESIAAGLNNEDQVVGSAMLPNGNLTAFLWQENTGMVNLGTLPGNDLSGALSINNAGQITGGCQNSSTFLEQGFLWQAGTGMTDIDPNTNITVAPYAINQQGQIYGTSDAGGFIYSDSTGFTQATVAGVSVSLIYAINGKGQMVVEANDTPGALLYSPGQGLFPIQSSDGMVATMIAGMNEEGTVAGSYLSMITATPHGFVWSQANGMTELTPDPNDSSWATGINELGQVVGGTSLDGQPFFPFLYENGTMYDLMSYLNDTAAGWSNLNLTAINDDGDIAGYGLFNGQEEAFLLTPTGDISVPEPAAISLAAGFCLPALGRRRWRGRGFITADSPA